MKTEFVISVADVKQLPPPELPEFAFAGRSNVGKSSLINAIIERKNLVKTGKTPGKTRLLNFFNIADKLMFVDLPGYGFAKVSKQELAGWGRLIDNYFNHRESLTACFILIDIRRGMEDEEKQLLGLLSFHGIAPCIVLTKVDKLSKNQLMNNKFRISKETGISVDKLVRFSSVTGEGKAEVRKFISDLTDFQWT